jgi:hypothetical protein
MGNWNQAECAFLTSIELSRKLGDINWRLNTMDGLAMTYLAQGRYGEALAILEQALADLPTIADKPQFAYLEMTLTRHVSEAKQKVQIAGSADSPAI